MRRRALLAAGAALVPPTLSGCVGLGTRTGEAVAELPTARLSMEAVDDAAIARRELHAVAPEDERDDPPLRERLLREVKRSGSAETERTRPPLPADRPVLYDGTVYRLDREVVEETPATRFSVKIDVVTGDEPEGRTVDFADLPKVDRRVFERNGYADGDVVGIGTTLLYTRGEVERSALVPETDIVIIEWPDARAEWVVDGGHDTSLKRYRYTVSEETPAAQVGADIRERFAWELSGLSDAERDIVETATGGERYVVGPDENPPAALRSLVERFRPHERVDYDPPAVAETTMTPTQSPTCPPDSADCSDGAGDGEWRDAVSGPYLVRYGGTVYWTGLSVRKSVLGTAE